MTPRGWGEFAPIPGVRNQLRSRMAPRNDRDRHDPPSAVSVANAGPADPAPGLVGPATS